MTVKQYIVRFHLYRASIEVVDTDGALVARCDGRKIPGSILDRVVFRYDLIGGRSRFVVVGGT